MSDAPQPPSTAVAVAPPSTDVALGDGVPSTWHDAYWLTRKIAGTPFVPKAIRGQQASVFAAIITGAELGLSPMQSLRMVNVIDGRPAASAELMRALVNRAGHRISVVDAQNSTVTLSGTRRDTGASARVTWTIEDAQRAKLLGNPSWAKYPRSMLLARATSELCRMLFADVIGGLYTPEETAAIDGHVYEPPGVELTEGVLVDPVTEQRFGAELADAELDDEDEADRRWIDEATGEIHETDDDQEIEP